MPDPLTHPAGSDGGDAVAGGAGPGVEAAGPGVGAPGSGSTAVLDERRFHVIQDPRGTGHLMTLVVSAVVTILLTRTFLAASGYPQIGGAGGLHIAHVLPGGLLMLAALGLGLVTLGSGTRPVAAVVGGIGFGLFIDEVGKFVTSDNDYFFRPTAAIIYAVFVVVVLAARRWRAHRPLTARERAAGAALVLVDALGGRASRAHREHALRELAAVRDQVPLAAEVMRVVERLPERAVHLPRRLDHVDAAARRGLAQFDRLAGSRWALPVMAALLVAQALGASVVAVGVTRELLGADGVGEAGVRLVGVLGGTAASLVLTLRGVVFLRTSRLRAVESFQRAVQVSLLITQVFLFASSQFSAVGGLVVDLVLLGVVSADLARARSGHRPDDVPPPRAPRPARPLRARREPLSERAARRAEAARAVRAARVAARGPRPLRARAPARRPRD